VLDRFYPPSPFGAGKPEAHWLLDEAGAVLVAAMLGVERKQLGWRRRDDWASHPQLAHRLEKKSFVTDLIAATLREPTVGVSAWYSSRDAAARLGNQQTGDLRPDTGFLLHVPAGAVECVLEWDRGTETQARLTEKLYGYRLAEGRLRASEPRTILFVVPGAGRVQTLQRAYAAFEHERERHRHQEGLVNLDGRWPLLVATVGDLRRAEPLGRVWQQIDEKDEQRVALTDLPVRSDLAPADPEVALGRRWRHDRPGFWKQLSPLSRPPAGAASLGCLAETGVEAAQPSRTSVPKTQAQTSLIGRVAVAHDEAAEAFVARLQGDREDLLAEARRDLAAAVLGQRRPDLRPSGTDGLMVDPEDELEEEQWR
jgi:hypothetical protein